LKGVYYGVTSAKRDFARSPQSYGGFCPPPPHPQSYGGFCPHPSELALRALGDFAPIPPTLLRSIEDFAPTPES